MILTQSGNKLFKSIVINFLDHCTNMVFLKQIGMVGQLNTFYIGFYRTVKKLEKIFFKIKDLIRCPQKLQYLCKIY